MQASKMFAAVIVLMGLALMTGCEKSKSKPAPEDISGTWSGILENDDSGEESSAIFTFDQEEAAVDVKIEYGDPSLFDGWSVWSSLLGAYSVSDGVLIAPAGNDLLKLTFSGDKAEGTFVNETVGDFSATLTKVQAE